MNESKRIFSKIGFISILVGIAPFPIVIIASMILAILFKPELLLNSNALLLISLLPYYIITFPLGIFLLRKLPVTEIKESKLSFKQIFNYLALSMFIITIGNTFGTFLSSLFTNGNASNPLELLMNANIFLKILCIAIITPIYEEYFFRKILVDRTIAYGKKTAIIFSGFVFGIFHMNLFQFFYAFGVGLVLAYMYVNTGKLRYSIIIHILINFIGSIVSPFIIGLVDSDTLNRISQGQLSLQMLSEYLGVFLIISIYLIIIIIGLIIFLKNIKKICEIFSNTSEEESISFKSVYLNAGMIVFTICCIIMTIFSLIFNTLD